MSEVFCDTCTETQYISSQLNRIRSKPFHYQVDTINKIIKILCSFCTLTL